MATQTKCEFQFPLIDFSNENMKPGNDEWLAACKVVRRGFEDHGGFLARFDKVGPELLKSVFSSMEELLSLPLETKRRKTSDKPKHGYVGEICILPLYESLAIDNASNIEDCKKFSNIMWPEGNNRFRTPKYRENSMPLAANFYFVLTRSGTDHPKIKGAAAAAQTFCCANGSYCR